MNGRTVLRAIIGDIDTQSHILDRARNFGHGEADEAFNFRIACAIRLQAGTLAVVFIGAALPYPRISLCGKKK